MKEKIIAKIRKLMALTTERGASEAEAMAAAGKLGQLMAEYNISQGELSAAQIKGQGFEEGQLKDESGKRTLSPVLNFSCIAIAEYTDTVVARVGDIGLRFFGQEQDVMAALFLSDLFFNTCDSDYRHWKRHGEGQFVTSRSARMNFERGFATRVNQRLAELKRARDQEVGRATGNNLMVVKNQVVLDAFAEKFGFRPKAKRERRAIRSAEAYHAGHASGNRVNITTGIAGSHVNSSRISHG